MRSLESLLWIRGNRRLNSRRSRRRRGGSEMGNPSTLLQPTAVNTHGQTASDKLAPRVAVVQDGARLHYALPLALQKVGLLHRVFTEWFVTRRSIEALITRGVKLILPAVGKRMEDRACPELSALAMVRNPWLALRQQWGRGRFRDEKDFFQSIRQSVGRWVEHRGLGDANMLMGF